MRYEVLERFEDKGGHNPFNFEEGTPMQVRLFPEQTSPRTMLAAMVMVAYKQGGWSPNCGIGLMQAVNSPDSLTAHEALAHLSYGEEDKRTWLERVRDVPDTRVPIGVTVDTLQGRPLKLRATPSEVVPEAYEMHTHIYVRDVGDGDPHCVDELLQRTEESLDAVHAELSRISPIREKIFGRR